MNAPERDIDVTGGTFDLSKPSEVIALGSAVGAADALAGGLFALIGDCA